MRHWIEFVLSRIADGFRGVTIVNRPWGSKWTATPEIVALLDG